MSLYELDSFENGISGEELRSWIEKAEFPSEGPYYTGDQEIPADYWEKVDENRNLDQIAEKPEAQWGICMERSSIRTFPMAEAVTGTPDDRYDDMLQETAILMNEPVVILHTSKDGEFYYVSLHNYRGWIAADAVGVCENYQEWKDVQEADDFLMVTGSRVFLSEDPYEPRVS